MKIDVILALVSFLVACKLIEWVSIWIAPPSLKADMKRFTEAVEHLKATQEERERYFREQSAPRV